MSFSFQLGLLSISAHEPSDDYSAMEGDGFYNRNSAMQAAGIALLSTLWETACKTVAISNDSSPVTIVIMDLHKDGTRWLPSVWP
jgi:hypothetical protein